MRLTTLVWLELGDVGVISELGAFRGLRRMYWNGIELPMLLVVVVVIEDEQDEDELGESEKFDRDEEEENERG